MTWSKHLCPAVHTRCTGDSNWIISDQAELVSWTSSKGYSLWKFRCNVFGLDADNWVVAQLCKTHHWEWHSRMNGYRWNARGVGA